MKDSEITLPWDSDHPWKLIAENSSRLSDDCINDFFTVISGPTSDGEDGRSTHVNSGTNDLCGTCYDLDANYYSDKSPTGYYKYPNRINTARLFQFRASARRGCKSCLVVFNSFAHFYRSAFSQGIIKARDIRREMLTGNVLISLRPGHIPVAMLFDKQMLGAFLSVEIFLRQGTSPWSAIQPSRSLPTRPSLSYCLSFVRPPLAECIELHGSSCPSCKAAALPARFLDVGTSSSLPSLKLVKTTGQVFQIETVKYIALSHCWGKSNILLTTTKNIDYHFHEVPWPPLSNTFKDAIEITRGLGVRYLWIDSLCIVQDDPLDWRSESLKMADIYSNSYLTIAATGSAEGSGGCLFPRWVHTLPAFTQRREEFSVLSGVHQGAPFEVCARTCTFDSDVHMQVTYDHIRQKAAAPLFSRAWCFQERMLSPRILHFHSEEMVFECGSFRVCECGFFKKSCGLGPTAFAEKSYREKVLQVSRDPPGESVVLAAWRNVVAHYSGLFLTRESDRLPALGGVAQRFSSVLNCRYVAGMWDDREDLPRALLWTMEGSNRYRRREQNTRVKIPTWSWASIGQLAEGGMLSGVYYYNVDAIDVSLEVLEVSFGWDNKEADFLAAPPIKLSVRGRCVSKALPHDGDDKEGLRVTVDVAGHGTEAFRGEKALCLLVGVNSDPERMEPGWARFLILKELPSGQFERLGVGKMDPKKHGNWFESVAPRELQLL
ncbi:hypothetical protein DL771_006715 [Monosporascus sp. 5C6A]|nr:hypothetical protein DL771_006715 [Monosporascus sp. 5C6A]